MFISCHAKRTGSGDIFGFETHLTTDEEISGGLVMYMFFKRWVGQIKIGLKHNGLMRIQLGHYPFNKDTMKHEWSLQKVYDDVKEEDLVKTLKTLDDPNTFIPNAITHKDVKKRK